MVEDTRPERLTARERLGHFNKMLVFIMLYAAYDPYPERVV
jgi:hypothetical protein